MSETEITFISYTKDAKMFVTTPRLETQFLNWLNSVSSSAGYKRETCGQIAIKCSPSEVHAVSKKEATVLALVAREAAVNE